MRKLILSFISVLLLLTGCTTAAQDSGLPYNTGLFAMDTYITMELYGDDADIAAGEASDKIEELEQLWSVSSPTSDIYKVNHSDGSTTLVNDETAEILDFALKMSDRTAGFLDITVYPVLKAWGFTTDSYRVPENREIDELIKYVDYRSVQLEGNSVTLPLDVELDLGAVGKGYAGDIAAEMIKEKGITSGFINLGGNVQLIGSKPDGSNWKLGIQSPFDSGNMGVLEVSDCAVVTSGNYEKYFIGEDGKRYCHILDPSTGYPVDNGLVSVTVVSDEGKYCDALSTALFVMGKDAAIEYWRNHTDFDFILVTEDGEISITPGIYESFAPNEGFDNISEIK